MTHEIRLVDSFDIRAADGGKPPTIEGYAAVFGKRSQAIQTGMNRSFTEVINHGAFTKALDQVKRGMNVPLLIEHEGLPLADTATGSLALSQDDKGLRFAAQLDPSDPDAQRLIPKVSRGLVNKMSFGFSVADNGDSWDMTNGQTCRTIRDVGALYDVSPVTSPAYLDTSVAMRSLSAWQDAETRIAKRPDIDPKEGTDKYGDVAFADPVNKKYPIDTEEHIRAAWNYINKGANAEKYTAEEVKTIKDRIIAAWKDKIDKAGPPSAEQNSSSRIVMARRRLDLMALG
jgi:uncharacterized protein